MTGFLLDTNAWIALLKGEPKVVAGVLENWQDSA